MQQRRGLASQWTAANPVLAAGEIGFETDTKKFKMGDGTSTWSQLVYFANATELTNAINSVIGIAPETLNTLSEIADALGDDPNFLSALATNARVDTIVLNATAAQTEQREYLSGSIASHVNNTMGAHGIADTSLLATKEYADTKATAAQDSAVALASTDATTKATTAKTEAITEAASLANTAITNAVTAITPASLGLGSVDNTTDLGKPVSSAQEYAIATAKTEAITEAGQEADTKISTHNNDETNVHGIANTADLATKAYADNAVSGHNNDTTDVHGIPDTSVLVTQTNLTDAITSSIVDQSTLAGVGIEWNAVSEAFDIDSTIATAVSVTDAVSAHNLDTTAVHGISDTSQLAYKNAANQTFTGNMEIDGNLVVDGNITVNGESFNASATSIVIEDNMVQLAHQNAANTVDLGLVVGYNDGAAKHAGFVRDVSDAKWKLFKGVTTEPSTTVDFTQGSLDDLKVAALEATTVTPSSGIVFSDGTQTKLGVPSVTTFATAISSSATLAAGESDKFVPLNGAVVITLPASGYSTGQSIDFWQSTGTGASFASTNGVVGTPGYKFRTTNSVVTAMKTSSGWLIFGDLSA